MTDNIHTHPSKLKTKFVACENHVESINTPWGQNTANLVLKQPIRVVTIVI